MEAVYENLCLEHYPIKIEEFNDPSKYHHLHCHEEIEILYFLQGNGVVFCDMKEYPVKAGDIILVNGKEIHKGCDIGNVCYYCIQINKDFFNNIIGNECVIFQNHICDSQCAEYLELIIKESAKIGFKSTVFMKKTLCDFFWRLINENYIKNIIGDDKYKKYFKRLDVFNSIVEYIEKNYYKDLSVKSLAEHFFMSTSHFSHLFKNRSGKSAIEYINEIRISRAKLSLEIEEISISELAGRVGFNDINYFSRKFKEITGFTPMEYKKNVIKKQKSENENAAD